MIYRTGHFTEPQKKDLRHSARKQEEIVQSLFSRSYPRALSPSQVHRMTGEKWPITSVRRAITNLTKRGVLIKTDRTTEGEYGRPEGMWKWWAGSSQTEMEL